MYLTLEKPKLSIGRQNTDIILTSDPSVSRSHCIIQVAVKNSCPGAVNTDIGVWIVDGGSKFGTFVQGANKSYNRIDKDVPKVLSHGSVVRFGVLDNIWR